MSRTRWVLWGTALTLTWGPTLFSVYGPLGHAWQWPPLGQWAYALAGTSGIVLWFATMLTTPPEDTLARTGRYRLRHNRIAGPE